MVDALFTQPRPQGLLTDHEAVPLAQLLHRQGGPKIPIVAGIQPQGLRLEPRTKPAVRRLATTAVGHPPIAGCAYPLHQAPDLPVRHPQQDRCLHLGKPPLQHVMHHLQTLELLAIHRHQVLSNHPALLVKAGRLV